jgi:streptogramin lyase
MLARASFIATLVTAAIAVMLVLAQVDIFLLNHPPVQLDAIAGAALKTLASIGTALGAAAAIGAFILGRINKRMAKAEQRRERTASVVGALADELQPAPEQYHRLSAGQGCAFPITVTVLGISIVVATFTYLPAQPVAAFLNNPITSSAGPTSTTQSSTPATLPTHTPLPHGTITTFPIPTAASRPSGITLGADGNLWFTEEWGDKIGRMTPAGTLTEFQIPTAQAFPLFIASGPDGNLWFTEPYTTIGRITPAGTITEFPVSADLPITGICAGPDGNIWFSKAAKTTLVGDTGQGKIGKMTPSGVVTQFPLPAPVVEAFDIRQGPDSALWFAEPRVSRIGRVTTTGGFSEVPIPADSAGNLLDLKAITDGPDGNLWFTANDDATQTIVTIGKMTASGAITLFPIGTRDTHANLIITLGPDGSLWFTEDTRIGRITPAGAITEFPLPAGVTNPLFIVAGLDGNLWFTDPSANLIGMLAP